MLLVNTCCCTQLQLIKYITDGVTFPQSTNGVMRDAWYNEQNAFHRIDPKIFHFNLMPFDEYEKENDHLCNSNAL